MAVLVFTDEDLAERYMKSVGIVGEIEPIVHRWALAQFLRGQPETQVVCFDPVKSAIGTASRFSYYREKLLKELPSKAPD